jgi:hypothetical protein
MPTPIDAAKRGLNDNQKSRLRRGVLFPLLAFLGTIALLVAGSYYAATDVDQQQKTTGAPTSDERK